jgi:hypothetical protein
MEQAFHGYDEIALLTQFNSCCTVAANFLTSGRTEKRLSSQ